MSRRYRSIAARPAPQQHWAAAANVGSAALSAYVRRRTQTCLKVFDVRCDMSEKINSCFCECIDACKFSQERDAQASYPWSRRISW